VDALLAVGDSLTGGHGLPVADLPCRSWASWLAWASVLPLEDHCVNGSTTAQLVRDQLPLLTGPYRTALTLLGANDLRQGRVPAHADLEAVLSRLREVADLVLVGTLPIALLPGLHAGPDGTALLAACRDATHEAARRTGVHVVVLDDLLAGPFEVGPDRLHPSALGQLALARRAAVALDMLGVRFARHLPDPAAFRPDGVERAAWTVGVLLERTRVAAHELRPRRS
jgi:lysophospholipase L1-like esterase